MKQLFPWNRYWCKQDGSYVSGSFGYPYDPEDETFRFYHKGVKTFEQISNYPCLILTGEPQIGKTTAIKREIVVHREKCSDITIYKNINEYNDENRLINEIFGSTEFEEWLLGDHRLFLFLDGLDECGLQNSTSILLNKFNTYKKQLNRLFVRIIIRTGSLDVFLETRLSDLFGDDNVGIYELMPLFKKDVDFTASNLGYNPLSFFNHVRRKELQPLTLFPITLLLILNEYDEQNGFPGTKEDYFSRACKILCTENNVERVNQKNIGKVSPLKRIALSSRIAAVMIFCNKTRICIHPEHQMVSAEELTLSMIQEGNEVIFEDAFPFSEIDLKEVIVDTGLFCGGGAYKIRFTHQAFTEYLAANFLINHSLNTRQLISLVQIQVDQPQSTIPQLKGVAGWLNTLHPKMLEHTIEKDPEVVLAGDIEGLKQKNRRDLIDSLFKLFEEKKLTDKDFGLWGQYHKLEHLEIDKQLEPYIIDKNKHFLVRRVAIDIAEACKVKPLQSHLTEISLDKDEKIHIRDQASHAVCKIADNDFKLKLKTFVTDYHPEDIEDQLKGNSLRALYPSQISTEEVFKAITPPRKGDFVGSYYIFISEELPDLIQEQELPVALKWIIESPEDNGEIYNLGVLKDKLVLKAWDHIDNKGILKQFAEVLAMRLESHKEIYPTPRYGNQSDFKKIALSISQKRVLVKAIVPFLSNKLEASFNITHSEPQLVGENDMDWIVEEMKREAQKDNVKVWVQIAWYIYRATIQNHFDSIYYAMKTCPELKEKFKSLYSAVDIDSSIANEMKAHFKQMQEFENKRKEREANQNQPIVPSPQERIEKLLSRFETGDYDAWWQLCLEMTLEDRSTHYGPEFESDLTKLPGWINSSEPTRQRIIDAAKKYVLNRTSNPEKWLGTSTHHRPAAAGYKALILLMKIEPSFISTLDHAKWKNWTPIIIGFPESTGFADSDDFHKKLVKKAYENSPEELISVLLTLIDKDNEQHKSIFILDKVSNCWDDKLFEAILEKVKDPELTPSSFLTLLSPLIKEGYQKALDFAKSLLKKPLPKEEPARNLSKMAACALLREHSTGMWDFMWKILQSNHEFGKQIFYSFLSFFEERRSVNLPKKIGTLNTADLYIWLCKQFPQKEDPIETGVHSVTTREAIGHYRDSLIYYLQELGTEEANNALAYIKSEFPEQEGINWVIVDAKKKLLEKQWNPISPKEFFKLVRNPNSRLVVNDDQLMDMVIESLARLEKKLRGETSRAYFLWDRITKNSFKPKPENALSDYIKIFLQDDLSRSGIIFLREVEIRPGRDRTGKQGEATDIYVTGINPNSQEQLKVIIEVKGCWHKEVNTAMIKQLADRYLKDNDCRRGIYLVGWYRCFQWDKRDSKKDKIKQKSIEDAQKFYDTQAAKLSNGKIIKACVLNCSLN